MSVGRSDKIPAGLLNALLADFERTTTVNLGGLTFDALDFDETFEVLPDAFRFRPPVGRRTAIGILRRSLIDCRNAGPITIDALLARANELDRITRAVLNQRYTIWTKFRATNMAHHPGFRLEWQGVRLRSSGSGSGCVKAIAGSPTTGLKTGKSGVAVWRMTTTGQVRRANHPTVKTPLLGHSNSN